MQGMDSNVFWSDISNYLNAQGSSVALAIGLRFESDVIVESVISNKRDSFFHDQGIKGHNEFIALLEQSDGFSEQGLIARIAAHSAPPLFQSVQIKNAGPFYFHVYSPFSGIAICSLQRKQDLASSEFSQKELVLENSQDIHLAISYDSKQLTYINPAISEILGFPVEMFLNKSPKEFYNLLYADDRDRYLGFWEELLDLEEQDVFFFSSEFKMLDAQGRVHWLNQHHKLLYRKKQPWLLLCNLRDITDLKNTEVALRSSEERLSYALEAARDGIWEYYPLENRTYFSHRWFEMLGYSADEFEVSMDKMIELIHPDDQSEIKKALAEFNTSGNPSFSREFRMKHSSGSWVWIDSRARKVAYTPDGRASRYVGTHTDISSRKSAELEQKHKNRELEETKQQLEALNNELNQKHQILKETFQKLQDSDEMFRQVAQNINDVFWLRTESEILYVNSAFKKIWGRDPELVIKSPNLLADWIYEKDRSNFEMWVNKKDLSPDQPYTEQYRIVKPDGSLRWIWSRIFPVYNEAGEVYRIVGIASDITEQKEFEEALKIAKTKAQENDKLKSVFLANISHEIRTPMNGIIGFADLISQPQLPEDTRKNYVNIIKKSSEQLIRIIDDIIDFAKIESNQIVLKKKKFNLNKLIYDLSLLFNNQLEALQKANITLIPEVQLSDSSSEFTSDEQRINQIMSNLIDNAIKYTEEGSIRFGYEVQKSKVVFYVKDSGIGIPEEKQEVIFERFRQADEGNTRKFGGTGLGLSISQGLIRLLDGEIWFESKTDIGTTFYFSIPSDVQPETSPDQENKEFDEHWEGKTVLVAEDDDINYEFIKALLEPTKVNLFRAEDGSQAVKMCTNLNFDLILMDVRLPVLNGLQATKHIRDLGIKTPIIAQTAFAFEEDRQKCLEAGCTDFISKPIKRTILFKIINELFR